MKKNILLMFVILTLLLSISILSVIHVEAGEDPSPKEWHTISSGYITGGNWSGSIYNLSFTPIFPPHEGNGIFYKNLSHIQTNVPNSIIFSLKLITIPNTYKFGELGEYLIHGEKIVAINFSKRYINNENNHSEVIFTLYSPEEKSFISQKLNLSENITILPTPIILNSSGLWKIKLDFISNQSSKIFQIWEDVRNWPHKDDEYYLTFSLTSNLSFKNYYEKVIPIFTTSEVIGYWQAWLTKEQGKYLNNSANSAEDTARSVKDIVQGQISFQIIAIIGTFVAAIGGAWFGYWYKDKNEMKRLTAAFKYEVLTNLQKAKFNLGLLQIGKSKSRQAFYTEAYNRLKNSAFLDWTHLSLSNDILDGFVLAEEYNKRIDAPKRYEEEMGSEKAILEQIKKSMFAIDKKLKNCKSIENLLKKKK